MSTKLTKEFRIEELVKEALSSPYVCNQWKQKILSVWPEYDNNKVEVGKWYELPLYPSDSKHYNPDNNIAYVFISSIDDNNDIKGYGIDWDGDWYDDRDTDKTMTNANDKTLRELTNAEIVDVLYKEANRRGFKGNFYDLCVVSSCGDELGFYGEINRDNAFYRDEWVRFEIVGAGIFTNGEWLEVKDSISIKEAEKILGKKIRG